MEPIKNNTGAETANIESILNRLFSADNAIEIGERESLPQRCRVILFDASGNFIAVMHRQKNGRDPYCVLPGGGVEKNDKNAIGTVQRELLEEFSITTNAYTVNASKALIFDDTWVLVGQTITNTPQLILGGPEVERNGTPERGYYEPQWVGIDGISSINLLPKEILESIVDATKSDGSE